MPRTRTAVALEGDDTLLTLSSAAALVDVNERSVRRWIADGRLPAYRLVVGVRVRRSDLLGMLQAIPAGTSGKRVCA